MVELGFENAAQIVSNKHFARSGDSFAIGTEIPIKYPGNFNQTDSIYIVFFVADIKDAEKAHITMMVATYYLHEQAKTKSLFEKIYSASKELLPHKLQIEAEMKAIMQGKHLLAKMEVPGLTIRSNKKTL